MTWLQIILWVVMNLPKIIDLIREIIDMIGGIKDRREMTKAVHALKFELQKAKHTKDFRPLEEMLERLKSRAERA